jgi:hypothetical protein
MKREFNVVYTPIEEGWVMATSVKHEKWFKKQWSYCFNRTATT